MPQLSEPLVLPVSVEGLTVYRLSHRLLMARRVLPTRTKSGQSGVDRAVDRIDIAYIV